MRAGAVERLKMGSAVLLFAWASCDGDPAQRDDDDGAGASQAAGGAAGAAGSTGSGALCPATCATDADCGACGTAKACLAGRCAACSPSAPCPGELDCYHGACVRACGANGNTSCMNDPDCDGCGFDADAWGCPLDLAACAPPASSCGNVAGATILPPPFATETSPCSTTSDCSGRSAAFEVGSLIRAQLGASAVVVDGVDVSIADASLEISVATCGAVPLSNTVSCGFCAPCDSDDDCGPYLLTPLKAALFAGDPRTDEAYAELVALLYGSSLAQLHFFCLPVTSGMGTCMPCSNITQSCAEL